MITDPKVEQMEFGISRSCMAFMNVTAVGASKRPDQAKAAFALGCAWPQQQVLFVGFVMEQLNTGLPRAERIKRVKAVVDKEISPLINLVFVWVDDGWDLLTDKHRLNERKIMTANLSAYKGMDAASISTELANIAQDRTMVPMIRISFNEQRGAYSYVGNQTLQVKPYNDYAPERTTETMNLGWLDEDKKYGVVLHEFLHSTGLMHEHQRSDARGKGMLEFADKQVLYDFFQNGINKWTHEETDNNVIGTMERDTLNSSTYDPLSIMHYILDCNLFKNKGTDLPDGLQCQVPRCPKDVTLRAIKRAMPDYVCSNNPVIVSSIQELSLQDKATISRMYPVTVSNAGEWSNQGGTSGDDANISDGDDKKTQECPTCDPPKECPDCVPCNSDVTKTWQIVGGVFIVLCFLLLIVAGKLLYDRLGMVRGT